MKSLILLSILFSSTYIPIASADVVDQLLTEYSKQTTIVFDSTKGETLWTKSYSSNKDSQARSCATCHTENLASIGKHAKTRKPIEPLAPSVNPKRLTDVKTINKWLLRNCKWTMGRECTSEEKGHLLKFISAQ
jgi:hypothetical protein